MASMRQRKADAASASASSSSSPSPLSRGLLRSDDEQSSTSRGGSTHIVIEDHSVDTFDPYYRPPPPRFIPDKYYKDFMLGKAINRKEVSIWPDSKTCASRCVGFSWVGASFLFWVYFLINTQPIFIKGIQPKGDQAIEGVTFKVSTADQRLPSAANAWYAAVAYLVTIFLCIAYRRNLFSYWQARIRRWSRKKDDYEDIPDNNRRRDGDEEGGLPTFRTYRNPNRWHRIQMQLRKCIKQLRRSGRNDKRRRE